MLRRSAPLCLPKTHLIATATFAICCEPDVATRPLAASPAAAARFLTGLASPTAAYTSN